MLLLVIIVIAIISAVVVPRFFKDTEGDGYNREQNFGLIRWAIRGGCIVIAITCFLMTSCLVIDSESVGHLKRVYLGKSMPPGRIIANTDEKGPQAQILPPGFHVIPFIRVTHDIEQLPIVTVEQGKYAFLVAKDGESMPEGQFIAPAWDNPNEMINAMKFMGYEKAAQKGVKGPQLTILSPGNYRLNRYMFDVYEGNSTDVPAGHVAVIKSNVGKDYIGEPILPSGIEATELSVPIVPKHYRGVWKDVFNPGEYYINQKAYNVTIVDTRVQTWKYLGGYTRKWIDLTVGDDGKIQQILHEEKIEVPEDAADNAVVLRVQGWDVFQDSRVQVQVTPENAPFVVASVGGLDAVRDKIITPNYRSILRNVVSQVVTVKEPVLDKDGMQVYNLAVDDNGVEIPDSKGEPKMQTLTRPRKVLDLLYHREELEKEVVKELVPAGSKAGLTVQWVRFGDPAVPPSLLIPGKRRQLAESLMATYKQEKTTQTERVETEKERARADQQANLMKSEIGIQVADNNKMARTKEGEGEKAYLSLVAKGQEQQANVLGKDKAFELAYIKEVLTAATKNPELIKYPNILVMGQGGGFEGAAAILGASNLNMGMKGVTKNNKQ
ncbi:MAG: hypothetical protein K9L62_10755 [Vallitaleaceae bacterium]|nr:hypothetical protein [Vallitaleaceae bacterium]